MTNDELEAIRARDAADYPAAQVLRTLQGVAGNGDPEMQATIDMIADRRALLAAYDELLRVNRDCVAHFEAIKRDYDALLAAARKVTCHNCAEWNGDAFLHCPDCADLRRILEDER